MVTVAIVGPSHAGKTALTRELSREHERYGFPEPFEILDLDQGLGYSHRSDVGRAIDLIRARAQSDTQLVLVNVGAGQIVHSKFRMFLESEPGVATVAIWCDEPNFRSRHSPETADREFRSNYSSDLVALWESCRRRDQLVDTSAPRTVEESADDLSRIIRRVAGMGEPPNDEMQRTARGQSDRGR